MGDHSKVRRESMRWNLILTLNHARPVGAHEQLVKQTLQGVYPDVTLTELRRELDYLEDRSLIDVERDPIGAWRAKLTHYGVDLAEYTVECCPGIARAEKYW